MRYLRMFLLHAQEVYQERGRLFVWSLLSWITPLILILFWRTASNRGGWTIEEITSYYLLVITMGIFLMSHHEERIARIDIQEGGLTAYLLKPFSYFWIRFFGEITYRIIQGGIGFSILFFLVTLFPAYFVFSHSPLILFLSCLVALLSLFLIFIFKTIVGFCAFWMTESRGAFEMTEATLALFAGYLMPIVFMPQWIQSFIYFLPFPYMIYFPVIAFEGKLTALQLGQIMGIQLVWIVFFLMLYKIIWTQGIKNTQQWDNNEKFV